MAKESLAAQAGLVPVTGSTQLATTGVQESPAIPYFGYLDGKTKSAVEIIGAGVKEGQPYLREGDKFLKLDPFKFHLIDARQIWVEYNDKFEPQKVEVSATSENWKCECFEVALLVYTSEGLKAARGTFRSYKTPIAKVAAKELLAAGKPGWASQSAEHKAAARIPEPFARFTVTATVRKGTAKTTGRVKYDGIASVAPTSAGDWDEIVKYLSDEGNKKKFSAVVEAFQARIATLLEKAK